MKEKEIRMSYSEFEKLNKAQEELDKYIESKVVIEHYDGSSRGFEFSLSGKTKFIITDDEVARTIERIETNANERASWLKIEHEKQYEIYNKSTLKLTRIEAKVAFINKCHWFELRRRYKLKQQLKQLL